MYNYGATPPEVVREAFGEAPESGEWGYAMTLNGEDWVTLLALTYGTGGATAPRGEVGRCGVEMVLGADRVAAHRYALTLTVDQLCTFMDGLLWLSGQAAAQSENAASLRSSILSTLGIVEV